MTREQLLESLEYLKKRYYREPENNTDIESYASWYSIEVVLRHCDEAALNWEELTYNRLKEKYEAQENEKV